MNKSITTALNDARGRLAFLGMGKQEVLEMIPLELSAEAQRKDEALRQIAFYDQEPIWMDDRDDAANNMLSIAREALGIE